MWRSTRIHRKKSSFWLAMETLKNSQRRILQLLRLVSSSKKNHSSGMSSPKVQNTRKIV